MQAVTTPLHTGSRVHARNRLLIWGLCAGLLVPALILLVGSLRVVKLDGDTTYPESGIVYLSLLAAKTGHVYRPLSQPPYSPAPYGPLLYLALAGVGRAAGLSLDGLEIAGRMLVLASFVALAWMIGAWGKQLTGSRLAAAAGCLFLLAQADAFPWNVTVRPDMLALLFSCWGLWLCTSRGGRLRPALAGACFGLAVLSKQSFVAAPLAAAIVLAWERRWKQLMLAMGAAALLAGGVLGLLLLRGDAVVSNLFLLGHSDIEGSGAVEILRDELLALDMRCILLPLALLAVGQAWRKGSTAHRALVLYFVLSWVQCLLLLLHVGSNYNTLLEPWTASAVLAAIAVAEILESGERLRAAAPLAVACGLLLAHGIYNSIGPSRPMVHSGPLARAVQGRRVLTDNPYLAARSADPVMMDSYFNNILELNGIWDSGPIRARLAQGGFDLVLLTVHQHFLRRWRGMIFFSPAILKQIGASYRLLCHTPVEAGYSSTAVWIPKSTVPDGELQQRLQEARCE